MVIFLYKLYSLPTSFQFFYMYIQNHAISTALYISLVVLLTDV